MTTKVEPLSSLVIQTRWNWLKGNKLQWPGKRHEIQIPYTLLLSWVSVEADRCQTMTMVTNLILHNANFTAGVFWIDIKCLYLCMVLINNTSRKRQEHSIEDHHFSWQNKCVDFSKHAAGSDSLASLAVLSGLWKDPYANKKTRATGKTGKAVPEDWPLQCLHVYIKWRCYQIFSIHVGRNSRSMQFIQTGFNNRELESNPTKKEGTTSYTNTSCNTTWLYQIKRTMTA